MAHGWRRVTLRVRVVSAHLLVWSGQWPHAALGGSGMATREELGGLTAQPVEGVLIDGKPVAGVRAKLWVVLQSRPFQTVSMACTFYALFASDVCYGFLPASSDTLLLSVILSIVFFFFILESIATVIARPRSVCELFFYLDVVATLSLIAVRTLACTAPLPALVPHRRNRCAGHSVDPRGDSWRCVQGADADSLRQACSCRGPRCTACAHGSRAARAEGGQGNNASKDHWTASKGPD